ncbi:hypothetical protein Kpol_431p1 [Vanderwaltozyma polyspora DSM 70294]|uniref:Uncharacterized protein n=1 Tax=Vanderwaltozyma polyspora (strain ATCC 22028 / DSM 70294 / BCRC 21397 / CBS 2163 / NBRC 10782 / NRRL Y-8283 / UCD 57-17) TaxID=436907 RepID=A7TRM2_VANPO|nr:uncharacterized protein Kpol_431p1 [Vanderwaltozyma polyspora DSM 70294]EDO15074.1 hypothetical protein Kpol_431p1 [Vanderwaltozyma polyspora DSM 70294]
MNLLHHDHLKRTTMKIWFHHFFYREEYDDKFNNNENITIDENIDDLLLIPNLNQSNLLYSGQQNVEEYDDEEEEEDFEGSSGSNNELCNDLKLKKIRKFNNIKEHIKLKLKNHKFHHHNSQQSISVKKINELIESKTERILEKLNKTELSKIDCKKGTYLSNHVLVDLKKTRDLATLLEDSLRRCLSPTATDDYDNNFDETSPARELPPFQNLSYDEMLKFGNITILSITSLDSDDPLQSKKIQNEEFINNRGKKRDLRIDTIDSDESLQSSKRFCKINFDENVNDIKALNNNSNSNRNLSFTNNSVTTHFQNIGTENIFGKQYESEGDTEIDDFSKDDDDDDDEFEDDCSNDTTTIQTHQIPLDNSETIESPEEIRMDSENSHRILTIPTL